MRISRDCLANFVADFRTKFVRVSRECRDNFLVSRTSRELVAKFFNMLKNFMRFFSPKYFARLSRDCRATVARRSCECRGLVAAKFWRIYYAKFSRHSYDRRASVARRSRDSLAKTSRLSGEKIKRMSLDCRTNLNENKLHSRESRETLSRQSRDDRATVARYIFKSIQ